MFQFGDDEGESPPEEPKPPRWFGPPENELGVVLPQSIVLAHAERGVVALSHAVVYSTGVAFEFVAEARGLARSDANRVFHEQHMLEEQEDLSEALLRIGFELANGSRSCEWPVVDIVLTTIEIDGTPLVDAAQQAKALWP
jgi:hypothetical protein